MISEFSGSAVIEQEKLEQAQTAAPPTGTIPTERQEEVFARGLLNDVAASYFVKGRALEHLGRLSEARQAYREASKLTYARTFDPRENTFWSPAEAALGRLRTLPP